MVWVRIVSNRLTCCAHVPDEKCCFERLWNLQRWRLDGRSGALCWAFLFFTLLLLPARPLLPDGGDHVTTGLRLVLLSLPHRDGRCSFLIVSQRNPSSLKLLLVKHLLGHSHEKRNSYKDHANSRKAKSFV